MFACFRCAASDVCGIALLFQARAEGEDRQLSLLPPHYCWRRPRNPDTNAFLVASTFLASVAQSAYVCISLPLSTRLTFYRPYLEYHSEQGFRLVGRLAAVVCTCLYPPPSLVAARASRKVGFLRDPSVEDEKGQAAPRLRSGGGKSANAKAVAAAAKGKKRQAAQVSACWFGGGGADVTLFHGAPVAPHIFL